MKILRIILFFSPLSISFCQLDTLFQSNELINNLIEESTEDDENSQLYTIIDDLINNPIDINTASSTDLLKIPTMDFQTVQSIINYRDLVGRFSALNELYSIIELDKETIDKIIIFLTLGKSPIINSIGKKDEKNNLIKIEIRSRIIEDIQNRKGFRNNNFEGNKFKIYSRFKGSLNNYKFNFLTDKDPGEKLFTDFYSFNINIDKIYFFEKIILGDYIVEHGQGLALWGPYAFSKGSEAVSTTSKSPRGISAYNGSDENQFFRGIALSYKYRNFDMSLFYSANKADANISENGFINSRPIDGFHRSSTEISKKDAAINNTFGGIFSYKPINQIKLDFLYYNSKFNLPLNSDKFFDLKGNYYKFYSIAYSALFDNFLLNGEISYNESSTANIINLQLILNKSISLILSARNYPYNYFNIYSRGFGESSNTQNEIGFYAGLKTKINSTTLNIYFDQFKFPFATNSIPVSSLGNEFLIDIYHSFSSILKLRVRYSSEKKEINTETESGHIVAEQLKRKLRTELMVNISRKIILKSRVEYAFYNIQWSKNDENGILIFQDISYIPNKKAQVTARLIFFESDSYNSRIYEFENDLTGILTNMSLFGKGTRWYIVFKYNILNNVRISTKYSELFQPELKTISSGLNEIEGNIFSKFSLQIDIKF